MLECWRGVVLLTYGSGAVVVPRDAIDVQMSTRVPERPKVVPRRERVCVERNAGASYLPIDTEPRSKHC